MREAIAGWVLISERSWSSTARHSTRMAEIEGVLNASAEAPIAVTGSKQKAASQRVSKRTAFVLNASPPGACPAI